MLLCILPLHSTNYKTYWVLPLRIAEVIWIELKAACFWHDSCSRAYYSHIDIGNRLALNKYFIFKFPGIPHSLNSKLSPLSPNTFTYWCLQVMEIRTKNRILKYAVLFLSVLCSLDILSSITANGNSSVLILCLSASSQNTIAYYCSQQYKDIFFI